MSTETETAARDRPTWDTVWLAMAQTVAYRSRCDKAQVGAVIVTLDNRMASASYNGPPPRQPVSGTCGRWCPRMQDNETSGSYDRCLSIHAEANGLLRANFTDIRGGTIYVSRSCCINCARLIAGSGLNRLVHVVSEADMFRDPDGVEQYLRQCGLSATRASRVDEL